MIEKNTDNEDLQCLKCLKGTKGVEGGLGRLSNSYVLGRRKKSFGHRHESNDVTSLREGETGQNKE